MRRLLLLTGLLVALAGCGGGGDESAEPAETAPSGGAAQTIELEAEASGALKFNVSSLDAQAGEVELVMANPSSVAHNVAVKGGGVDEKGEIVGKGGVSRVTVSLEPGTYTFYCSVPGHEAAGMKGDLTVSG